MNEVGVIKNQSRVFTYRKLRKVLQITFKNRNAVAVVAALAVVVAIVAVVKEEMPCHVLVWVVAHYWVDSGDVSVPPPDQFRQQWYCPGSSSCCHLSPKRTTRSQSKLQRVVFAVVYSTVS